MKKFTDKKVFRLVFCAVLSSLGIVLMMLSSLIPIGTFAIPCFAGMLTVAAVIEYGWKWALGVYAITAILSLFLAGDKEAVIYLIAIFGYYPILKSLLERKINNKPVRFFIKLIIFNITAIASFYAGMFLLAIPNEEYTLFGVYVPFVFLIVGNVFFVVYDYAVSVYVKLYVQRIRKILF